MFVFGGMLVDIMKLGSLGLSINGTEVFNESRCSRNC